MSGIMLEAACEYAARGFAVLPLNGKRPMFENWPETATTDQEMVKRWWTQFPGANIGVATGVKSGRFVVDVDPRHGGDQEWEAQRMSHPERLDTLTCLTGGEPPGKHVYFRCPIFRVKNYVNLLPGIDIRGDGGQVVVPPSLHPETHRRYEWDGLRDFFDQPIAEAPGWLLDLLQPKEWKPPSEIALKIPHGVQHYALLSLCGRLRSMGLTYDEMISTVLKVHDTRCERPGPIKNIERMVERVCRYGVHDKNLYNIAHKLWRMEAASERKQEEARAAMKPVDALTLFNDQSIDTPMIIEDCLHPGCTILAGPPKVGKSYLTLGMAVSVATGGKFIGARDVLQPGRVGYWALEESQSRTARRLKQLVAEPTQALSQIEFMYHLAPMFNGGLEAIRLYCATNRPTMIVIDTLMAFVSGSQGPRRDVMRDDYREIKALADISHEFGVAVVVVHHTNKTAGPFGIIQAVAGTHGVTAAADCIWVMEKQPERRTVLKMTGREIEEQAFLMTLDLSVPVGWNAIEEGDEIEMSGARQLVLEVLREAGPKTPKQLSSEIGQNPAATRQLIRRMVSTGLLAVNEKGAYYVIGRQGPKSQDWYDTENYD